MKRVLRFLIRLYPAWWRRRYGRELEALLEDAGSGWNHLWDLFRGAMEMQMSKWSFGRIVTVCGLAGVILAAVVAFSLPYRYRSTATLRMNQPDAQAFDRLAQAAFTPQALADIVRRERLYNGVPAEDVIDRMRRAIRIQPDGPNVARVSFAYEDPVQAQRTSQDLTASLISANLSRDANPNGLLLQLVAPADQPKKQFENKRLGLAGLGLPAGLLFGVVLALILRRGTSLAAS